jgi:hypothetical protein
LGDRRIDLRSFYAFDNLRKSVGAELAANLLFAGSAREFLDAIKVDTLTPSND